MKQVDNIMCGKASLMLQKEEIAHTSIVWRYVPSIPAFWRAFIINGC